MSKVVFFQCAMGNCHRYFSQYLKCTFPQDCRYDLGMIGGKVMSDWAPSDFLKAIVEGSLERTCRRGTSIRAKSSPAIVVNVPNVEVRLGSDLSGERLGRFLPFGALLAISYCAICQDLLFFRCLYLRNRLSRHLSLSRMEARTWQPQSEIWLFSGRNRFCFDRPDVCRRDGAVTAHTG